MAKQYTQSDFDHIVYTEGQAWRELAHSNDDLPRIVGEREPPKQSAGYKADYAIPGIANDDRQEQQKRAKALHREFERLKAHREELSPEVYQQAERKLLIGMRTLCRDPGCSASPTAKAKLCEKTIDKGPGMSL